MTGAPKRILVVDDDAFARAHLRAILERDDHRILEAENAARALELISAAELDLVLLDLVMPVMSGIDLLRQLQRAWPPRGRRPRVIVISSMGYPNMGEEVWREGALGFIAKPFASADVVREVNSALRS